APKVVISSCRQALMRRLEFGKLRRLSKTAPIGAILSKQFLSEWRIKAAETVAITRTKEEHPKVWLRKAHPGFDYWGPPPKPLPRFDQREIRLADLLQDFARA